MNEPIDIDGPVAAWCSVCGGGVVTSRRAIPLCIVCRDGGLRTKDDLADADEAEKVYQEAIDVLTADVLVLVVALKAFLDIPPPPPGLVAEKHREAILEALLTGRAVVDRLTKRREATRRKLLDVLSLDGD